MDSDDILADLSRRTESLIRLGAIAEVDHANVRVKVSSGQLTTTWLPWLTLRAGTTTTWSPPTVGEQVVLLSPSGEPAAGIVLVGLNSDAVQPPENSPHTHVVQFADGARIRYNQQSSHLDVTGIKTALVQAAEKVTVDVPETEITGNVLIKGNLHVNGTTLIDMLLTYMSGMSGYPGVGGSAAGSTIRGDITQLSGNFNTQGRVDAAEDVTAGAISLQNHTHQEHGTGGGTTGPAA